MLMVLHGGLGNQLFQVSVACALSTVTRVELSTAHLASSGRPCEIARAAEYLDLPLVDKPCPTGHQSYGGAVQFGEASHDCCAVYYPGEGDIEWAAHHSMADQFLGAVQHLLGPPPNKGIEHDTIVVHARLGDYLWPKAARTYGVLRESYYLSALENLFEPSAGIHIVAEDLKAVGRIYPKLSSMASGASSSDSVLEDLRILASGAGLISANSSLSMWAGWLGRAQNPQFATCTPNPLHLDSVNSNFVALRQSAAAFWDPKFLILRHPWVLTRRLKWQKSFWL